MSVLFIYFIYFDTRHGTKRKEKRGASRAKDSRVRSPGFSLANPLSVPTWVNDVKNKQAADWPVSIHVSGNQKGNERVLSTLRFRKFPGKLEGVWCSILATLEFP